MLLHVKSLCLKIVQPRSTRSLKFSLAVTIMVGNFVTVFTGVSLPLSEYRSSVKVSNTPDGLIEVAEVDS